MRDPALLLWLSLKPFCLILSLMTMMNYVLVSGQCLDDQRSHLLHLKNSLSFDPELSKKLIGWNPEMDCCSWSGVRCDASGRVISLELDGEQISGDLGNVTGLWNLQFLERLNLAGNYFSNVPIPKGIANLTQLVYLNLSESGFSGQVPVDLSELRKLVYLDLSTSYPGKMRLKLENPNLEVFVQNLPELEELHLDGVDLSAQRSNWCQVLASSLPQLKVLSLVECNISGPIDASLIKLRSLSLIRLDRNYLSTTVPDFFANFSNLRTLSLSDCDLKGIFPGKILQLQTLESVDLSLNSILQGDLQSFPVNGSLRSIELSHTSFAGSIPPSIGNLKKLSSIKISECNFSGPIPSAVANLADLAHLDFSVNNFSGPIPPFRESKNLVYIDLSRNGLTGSLSSAHFGGLKILNYLQIGSNSLSGSLPSNLFTLPSLHNLLLADNQFSGQIPSEISSLLSVLDLSSNRLNGSLPKSLFDHETLYILSLSFNSFSGSIQLGSFKNVLQLDLSYNNFTIEPYAYNTSLPMFYTLNLASCKLQKFPDLRGQLQLTDLDLSNNQIKGEVPKWIWSLGNGYLTSLNLSFNLLDGLQKPFEFPSNLYKLDLKSNLLQGEIPIPPESIMYVDYSSNRFISSIPQHIGSNFSFGSFFSVSNNSLTGSIPDSVCFASDLIVLDLSYNAFNGTIPSCLAKKSGTLSVLNLARNNFSGSIPNAFPVNCNLKTLDLSMNGLKGEVPKSLANCRSLEVLNIGNNEIEDTFPCIFENSSSLHVLVLRSNRFHGGLQCVGGANNSWSRLQIIDISSNSFRGVLSPGYFSKLTNMIYADPSTVQGRGDHLRFEDIRGLYYQDKVTVAIKGTEIELSKILTIFNSMDFSCNKFSGNIPDTIGDLTSLYVLNLSQNGFTGQIPSSLGKLRNLGSLDLSRNQITGEIPAALADLTFLSFLNLSFNDLKGRIPSGSQLQTFSNSSYMGNTGLCGYPLNVSCGGGSNANGSSHPSTAPKNNGIEWEYVSASVGFTVGLGTFMILLLFCQRWREMIFEQVDQLIFCMVSEKTRRRISPQRFGREAVRGL